MATRIPSDKTLDWLGESSGGAGVPLKRPTPAAGSQTIFRKWVWLQGSGTGHVLYSEWPFAMKGAI